MQVVRDPPGTIPRIRLLRPGESAHYLYHWRWVCLSPSTQGYGHTPKEAYDHWNW